MLPLQWERDQKNATTGLQFTILGIEDAPCLQACSNFCRVRSFTSSRVVGKWLSLNLIHEVKRSAQTNGLVEQATKSSLLMWSQCATLRNDSLLWNQSKIILRYRCQQSV